MSSITLFFWHNVLATFLIGGKLAMKNDKVFRSFGIALLLDAVAFAIWSVAVTTKPGNLETYVTWGTVFFIVSLIFFLFASSQDSKNRSAMVLTGLIVGAVILYLRAFVYPSTPGFSEQGFFFFNPHPVIQMLYIFGLLLATIPAIDAVAAKIKSPYNKLFRYGFLAEVAGGVVLLTSSIANPDTKALYITGWIIGLVYLALWTTFVFNRKVWQ